jgi:hypothetical protein
MNQGFPKFDSYSLHAFKKLKSDNSQQATHDSLEQTQAHYKAWQWIIATPPCQFSRYGQWTPGCIDCQSGLTLTTENRAKKKRLGSKESTLDCRFAVNFPAAQIKMLRSHHIYPCIVFKHSKIQSNARIAIQDLVLPIPAVAPPIDIAYS